MLHDIAFLIVGLVVGFTLALILGGEKQKRDAKGRFTK